MLIAYLATVLAVTLPGGSTLAVDPAASELRYHVHHKLHSVVGKSSDIEGKALIQEDGRVLCMVRVPVASFRSGDGNRDAHMLETVEVDKYPYVVWKGMATVGPGALPTGGVAMTGELEFHGVSRPATVPVTIERAADGTVHVRGSLDVDLDAYRIDRPSLLFVKIDDLCRIEFDLVLKTVT